MPRKTKKEKGSVLIIDDDKDILSTLREVLEGESYTVYTANEGDKGLLCATNLSPDIIFLDVWLPHIDGLELLRKIKNENENVPVVMMSGHAGIETAVRATKSGACDFIEKPFNIEKVIEAIEKNAPEYESKKPKRKKKKNTDEDEPSGSDKEARLARAMRLSKKNRRQLTIGKSVVLNGLGLLSGKKVGLQLLPTPPNSGIKFVNIVKDTEIELHPDNIISAGMTTDQTGQSLANSTALSKNGSMIRTVEHLLAAVHAFGITNLTIKVDEEIPNIDGSAIDFANIIKEAGISEQREKIAEIVIDEEMVFGTVDDNEQYMVMSPFDGFEISLRIDFDQPIGEQSYTFNMNKPEDFINEIAPARSFNTLDKINSAQKSGMVGSGMIGSHIIIHENKIINTELKFEDEFVRHKILDIIGDLYILGRPLKCRIKANKTSHKFNHAVVKELAAAYGL